MLRKWLCSVSLLIATPIFAGWNFGPARELSDVHGAGVFHHLESAGRRNIAVAAGVVAAAWEDDHDGVPRVRLRLMGGQSEAFGAPITVSGPGEAFEPTLLAVGADRFAIAWEEDGRIQARTIGVDGTAAATMDLQDPEAGQASLSAHEQTLYLVRAAREGRFRRIRLAVLAWDSGGTLRTGMDCAVDQVPALDDQLYPASAVVGDEVVVAWEDRRPGHTIIMAAAAPLNRPCAFSAPIRISQRPGDGIRRLPYGKGHGVARVALASFGPKGLFAVWEDKRNFREGYDIYGAAYQGHGRFGENQRVQDDFGELSRQWHATVAGHPAGPLVAAWSDEREGNSDIFFAMREQGVWGENLSLPGASGPGEQSHPSLTLDAGGNLHVAWVFRETVSGPTRLYYLLGRAQQKDPQP